MMAKYDLEKFAGVHVAMNSCYDENGEISTHAVKRFTRFLIDKGVNGLYVCGSTGEGLLQSVEERKQVLEAVIAENQGSIAVIAHVGTLNTRDSMALAEHAEQAGADAISAVPPFYYRYSEKGVRDHWHAIMDRTDLPFIIYHIPATTGFQLSPALFKQMLSSPKMVGVKITTASSYELQQLRVMGGDDILIFNGPDEQLLAGRVMGATAGIGGTYGIMPELFLAIERCYREGDIERAQQFQTKVNEVITKLLQLPIHSALKEILKLRGVDCGSVRAPLEEVTEEQLPAVQEIYEQMMGYVEDSFIGI